MRQNRRPYAWLQYALLSCRLCPSKVRQNHPLPSAGIAAQTAGDTGLPRLPQITVTATLPERIDLRNWVEQLGHSLSPGLLIKACIPGAPARFRSRIEPGITLENVFRLTIKRIFFGLRCQYPPRFRRAARRRLGF